VSDLAKIFLTSGLTIIGGVIVLVIGQLVQKFLLEPAHEQTKLIGSVLFNLTYYAPWYANPGQGKEVELEKASDAIRQCASQLKAATSAIRGYGVLASLRLIPSRERIEKAIGNLIFVANSIHSGDGRENRRNADEVFDLLGRGVRRASAP